MQCWFDISNAGFSNAIVVRVSESSLIAQPPEAIDAAINDAGANWVAIDLQQVEFVSSEFLTCFVKLARQAQASGGALVLLHCRQSVLEVMEPLPRKQRLDPGSCVMFFADNDEEVKQWFEFVESSGNFGQQPESPEDECRAIGQRNNMTTLISLTLPEIAGVCLLQLNEPDTPPLSEADCPYDFVKAFGEQLADHTRAVIEMQAKQVILDFNQLEFVCGQPVMSSGINGMIFDAVRATVCIDTHWRICGLTPLTWKYYNMSSLSGIIPQHHPDQRSAFHACQPRTMK